MRDPYDGADAAELVQRGNIVVAGSWAAGRVTARGSAFNPSACYPYTVHPAAGHPAMLRQYAGPQSSISG